MAASPLPTPHDAAPSPATPDGWPKVTLYGDLNMRPFRNLWMLEEIGLPYAHVACKPRSSIAMMVHPLGKVPALLVEYDGGGGDGDGGPFVVLESAAINAYLGDLARELTVPPPSRGNGGDDARGRGRERGRRDDDNGYPGSTTPARDRALLVPPPATPQRAKHDSLVMFVMTEIDSQSLWIHRKHSPSGGGLSKVFGEAPAAVDEARRQFGGALDAVVGEIAAGADDDAGAGGNGDGYGDGDGGGGRYLLSTGFSAADIIFANCCFWAQQIGWLERREGGAVADDAGGASGDGETTATATATTPKLLDPKLGAYLERCRARPAFKRASELRRVQVYEEKEGRSGFPNNKNSRL